MRTKVNEGYLNLISPLGEDLFSSFWSLQLKAWSHFTGQEEVKSQLKATESLEIMD